MELLLRVQVSFALNPNLRPAIERKKLRQLLRLIQSLISFHFALNMRLMIHGGKWLQRPIIVGLSFQLSWERMDCIPKVHSDTVS